jgi:hypothetical protein
MESSQISDQHRLLRAEPRLLFLDRLIGTAPAARTLDPATPASTPSRVGLTVRGRTCPSHSGRKNGPARAELLERGADDGDGLRCAQDPPTAWDSSRVAAPAGLARTSAPLTGHLGGRDTSPVSGALGASRLAAVRRSHYTRPGLLHVSHQIGQLAPQRGAQRTHNRPPRAPVAEFPVPHGRDISAHLSGQVCLRKVKLLATFANPTTHNSGIHLTAS